MPSALSCEGRVRPQPTPEIKAPLPIILFLLAVTLTRGQSQTALEGPLPQDEHFEFHSPFGSDGTNQPNLDPETRNALVFNHVWGVYVRARQEILKPLSRAQGYNQSQSDLWTQEGREAQLLETMAELRAFTSQNPGYGDKEQKSELVRIDRVLRSLDVHYTSIGVQGMSDFCASKGVDQVSKKLAPILYEPDGTPRPLPVYTCGDWRVEKATL